MSEELAREFQRENLISASMIPFENQVRSSDTSDDSGTGGLAVVPNTDDDLLLAKLLQEQFDHEAQVEKNRHEVLGISLGSDRDGSNARKLKNGDSIGEEGKLFCSRRYFLTLIDTL